MGQAVETFLYLVEGCQPCKIIEQHNIVFLVHF